MRAGTLEIELISNVARLQTEMRDAQRAIDNMTNAGGQSLNRLGGSFKAVNDNAAVTARQIQNLKAQLDPAWAAQQRYNDAVRLGMEAMKAGAITREQFITHMRTIHAEYKRTGSAIVESSARQRAGLQQVGFNLADVAVQYAGSARAGMIFAQQGPQIVQAMMMMGAEGSKFASFMSGPWGVAILIGVSVLGALVSKMTESESAAAKAKAAHLDLSSAQERQRAAQADLNKAIDDYNEKQTKATETTRLYEQQALAAATADFKRALAKRELLAATLYEQQEAAGKFEKYQGPGVGQDIGANLTSNAIEANNADILRLQTEINNRALQLGDYAAKALDPLEAIRQKYDDIRKIVRDTSKLGMYRGQPVGDVLKILGQWQRDEEQRQRASASASNRQSGREIDMAQARAIAQRAGLKVNSGTRPTWIRDEVPGGGSSQERLYNQWVAQGRPKDNPTAKPGTSAHERSNALDIQFGPGVTAASIRKAYADEGVRLTKLLKERGHFHIEWSTSGADKVEREAQRLADFGDKTAESIARINSQFDAAPTLIDQAATATRQLDSIIADLTARKPPGFEQMIADAQKAKTTVQDALVRPYTELEEAAKRRSEIELLNTQGRTTEAEIVQTIYGLEQKLGKLSADRVEFTRKVVENEARARDHARAIVMAKQVQATIAATALEREMAAQRIGIMSSGMNYAQQQEALRQLNIEQEKRVILLQAEAKVRDLLANKDFLQAEQVLAQARADMDQVDAKGKIDGTVDAMQRLKEIGDSIDFGSIFGAGGEAIDGMVEAMKRLQEAEVAYQITQQSSDPRAQKKGAEEYARAKTAGTLQMLSASKRFFKEESAGYKMIMALEKALAIIEMINTVKSIALDTAKTGSSVGNALVRGAADQAAGAAKMFSFLGPFAFPVVAAMIALLAGLGLKGGGSAAPTIPTAEELQEAAGTGSVLGDGKAKSNSIANSLEIVASNSNRDLEYSNKMLRSLRGIEDHITKLAVSVAKQITVSGSMFDTSGLRLGSSGSSGFLGLFSSSTTRELWDLGLDLTSSNVADIIANGIKGQTYQIVQQIKKKSGFLGIGGGTSTTYETTYGQIDPSITSAISDVLASLRAGLLEASKVIGFEGADAIIDNFQVELGRISFKDMTGEEIENQLNAIFSKVGDDMAGAILPSLKEMQKIGEGLFETFMRVAREYQVVDTSLSSIGMEFGAVGVASLAARDNLVQLFGTLDDFTEAVDFYRENFLTEAEQIAPIYAAVTAEMQRLGLANVDTIDEFKAVVDGLDLTTQAGRDLFAALMQVAPAFSAVEKYQDKIVKQYTDQADALKAYRDELTKTNTASSFAAVAAEFRSTAASAAMGDLTAMGNLKTAGNAFLDAAKLNATSADDYARARAEVLNSVDDSIFAAETMADYAQLQIDAAERANEILTEIRDNMAASLLAIATNTSATARILDRIEGDGVSINTPVAIDV